MAKPFYSMDEVCELLGKSVDDVRGLVRKGTLREFRDAGKIFFKAEDVDKISAKPTPGKSGSGEITLEPADEEVGGIGSGGTSVIGLEPIGDEAKADKDKDDTVITASGIGVFDDDELEIDADPMAKTQITTGAIGDQVTLEGSGSGSGLLDLTRESDDTSLGAELLDEIYPGEEDGAAAAEAPAAEAEPDRAEEEAESALDEAETGEVLEPSFALAVGDPSEGMFSGLLVGTLLLLVVSGTVAAGALQGLLPDYARFLSDNFLWFLIGAVVVPALCLLVGMVIGRAATPRRM